MARNVAFMPVPPERVFEVLSDPDAYAFWVVGSETVRDADDSWPAVGSKFHHRIGLGPIKINDNTEVVDAAPPHLLVLQARARPLGTARVTLMLTPEGQGTRVTMIEEPGDLVTRIVHNPLLDAVIARRNGVSLRRLQMLATAA